MPVIAQIIPGYDWLNDSPGPDRAGLAGAYPRDAIHARYGDPRPATGMNSLDWGFI